MGGSKSSQQKTQTINTTTTTNIRDIGFTGAHAVQLADILEAGTLAQTQVNADLVKSVLQETGDKWNALVGGAGDLVQTAGETSKELMERSKPESDFMKMLPWISIAGAGALIALKGMK